MSDVIGFTDHVHDVRLLTVGLDVVDDWLSQLGSHDARRDRVHPNLIARPLLGTYRGQHHDCSLRYAVHAKTDIVMETGCRADVDDRPTPALLHHWMT